MIITRSLILTSLLLIACSEKRNEEISYDQDIDDVLGQLKVFREVQGNSGQFQFELKYERESKEFHSVIRKIESEDLTNQRFSVPTEAPLCESEELNLDFARCARDAAESLGCIVVRTCAWCVFPCDED